jgi:hypothetical protein
LDLHIGTCLTHQHNDVLQKIFSGGQQGDEKLQRIDHSLSAAKFNFYVRTSFVFYAADNAITQIAVFSMIHFPTTVHRFFDYRPSDSHSSDCCSSDCYSSDCRSSNCRSSDCRSSDCRSSDNRSSDYRSSDDRPSDYRSSENRSSDDSSTDYRFTDYRFTDFVFALQWMR